mmetsp:Transcript_70739/g.182393  ORF Transcript_70739/g.182393 Transcript_70739/m.182393 type:complete len:313 (+) Transcript_70739:88-1026(+)
MLSRRESGATGLGARLAAVSQACLRGGGGGTSAVVRGLHAGQAQGLQALPLAPGAHAPGERDPAGNHHQVQNGDGIGPVAVALLEGGVHAQGVDGLLALHGVHGDGDEVNAAPDEAADAESADADDQLGDAKPNVAEVQAVEAEERRKGEELDQQQRGVPLQGLLAGRLVLLLLSHGGAVRGHGGQRRPRRCAGSGLDGLGGLHGAVQGSLHVLRELESLVLLLGLQQHGLCLHSRRGDMGGRSAATLDDGVVHLQEARRVALLADVHAQGGRGVTSLDLTRGDAEIVHAVHDRSAQDGLLRKHAHGQEHSA